MKKPLFFLSFVLLALLALSSCSNTHDVEPADEGHKTIQFAVINYIQSSFPDEDTRAASIDSMNALVMAVYKTDGTQVKLVTQRKGAKDYGTFTLDLPYGDYEVAFFAHNSGGDLLVDGLENVHFTPSAQGERVPDTFLKYIRLTVDGETPASQSILLQRCCAYFRVFATDAVPKEAAKLVMTVTGAGTAFNAKTGLAINQTRTNTNFLSGDVGKKDQFYFTYLYLPSPVCTATVEAVVYDKNDKVLFTHLFSDVPLAVNKQTTYRGHLYEKNSPVQAVSLDTARWEEETIAF